MCQRPGTCFSHAGPSAWHTIVPWVVHVQGSAQMLPSGWLFEAMGPPASRLGLLVFLTLTFTAPIVKLFLI